MLADPAIHLLTYPPGSATVVLMTRDQIQNSSDVAAMLVREDKAGLAKYPRKCSVAFSFGAVEIEGVVLVPLLCRLADRDDGTFESWINVADKQGAQLLDSLVTQPHLNVHILVDDAKPVRTLRSPNRLGATATVIIEELRNRPRWSMEAFRWARQQLERRYPTVQALWKSMGSGQCSARWRRNPTER